MTVQLCDNHTCHVNLLLEGPGLCLTRLSNGGVHHKDHIVRAHCIAHRQHLFKERILVFVHLHPISSNNCGINFCIASIERNASFCSILFQLIISSSSECVSTDQAGFPVF